MEAYRDKANVECCEDTKWKIKRRFFIQHHSYILLLLDLLMWWFTFMGPASLIILLFLLAWKENGIFSKNGTLKMLWDGGDEGMFTIFGFSQIQFKGFCRTQKNVLNRVQNMAMVIYIYWEEYHSRMGLGVTRPARTTNGWWSSVDLICVCSPNWFDLCENFV